MSTKKSVVSLFFAGGRQGPTFKLRIVGDAQLRPILNAAVERVGEDREVSIDYYFCNGVDRECDAVLVFDSKLVPNSGKPWRNLLVSRVDSSVAVDRVVGTIKQLIDEAGA